MSLSLRSAVRLLARAPSAAMTSASEATVWVAEQGE